jgi:ribosomal protein S18 acetylase RimI-like enzyme
MNISELQYKYADSLVDFYDRNQFDFFKPHEFNNETIRDILISKNHDMYYVVTLHDNVIAYGVLRGMDEGYSIPSLGIAIDKNYQGLGIGRLFMGFLEMSCKLKGYKSIRLRVIKENLKAIKFYKDLGYDLSYYDKEHLIGVKHL